MANGSTLNLAMVKPEVGADDDAWGGHINSDLDTIDALLPGAYNTLTGLKLSVASNTSFSVAVGVAADSTNAVVMVLASAITKTAGAWVVGTGNGGLDTGVVLVANTWYHVYEIRRPDTGVVDILLSTSASAPTMPTNYTQKRRLGSLLTDSSAHFISFLQDGDFFAWATPTNDVSAVNPGTAAVTRTLNTPTGVRTRAYIDVGFNAAAPATDNPGTIYISDLSAVNVVPNASTGAASFTAYSSPANGSGIVLVMTDTSSQIRSRIGFSTSGTTLYINTIGWFDARGRDG